MALFNTNIGGGSGNVVSGSVVINNYESASIDFGGVPKKFSILVETTSNNLPYEQWSYDEDYSNTKYVKATVGQYTTGVNWTPASTLTMDTSTRARKAYYFALL